MKRLKKYGLRPPLMILLIILAAAPAEADRKSMRVTFLNPSSTTDLFWSMATDFMSAAAGDLHIELEVLNSDRNHILTVQQGREVIARATPPDYILTGNDKRSAGPIIELAAKRGIKVFVFNNGFVEPKDIAKFGRPRQHYPNWIGQFIPDNYGAGYQIGEILIRQGIARGLEDQDGLLKVVAFAGTYATHASLERTRGLRDAVKANAGKVSLLQVLPGDWSEKTAINKAALMFRRYGDSRIGAIWGVNDATIFGVMKSAKAIGILPGRDTLFGSCGWHTDAIKMVQTGALTTSVGGHYMDGAWSLVMLYDYHHGVDFIDDPVRSAMYSVDASNVDRFLATFGQEDWSRIDFTSFSKVGNPDLSHYDFSLETVIKTLE